MRGKKAKAIRRVVRAAAADAIRVSGLAPEPEKLRAWSKSFERTLKKHTKKAWR